MQIFNDCFLNVNGNSLQGEIFQTENLLIFFTWIYNFQNVLFNISR